MKKVESIKSGAPEKLGRRVYTLGYRKEYTECRRTKSTNEEKSKCFEMFSCRCTHRVSFGKHKSYSDFIKALLNTSDIIEKALELEHARTTQLKYSFTLYAEHDVAVLLRTLSESTQIDMSILLRYIAWRIAVTGWSD